MTERLYYIDSYCREFQAEVQRVEPIGDGRWSAILDRSAFYPTSGGQPFDTGTLSGARVTDVFENDDGRVVHVIDRAIDAGPVKGHVDWPRRFEHMQQHTGQHLLSAAFDRLLQGRTIGFHLGSMTSTIDLSREVSAGEITRAEEEANRIVWEDRPVDVRFVDAAEAAALPLRKEPARDGLLRLVDVREFDLSACGGTHVNRTGAVGIVAVTGSERVRGGSRIEFACGGRALRSHRLLRDTVTGSVRLLSVLPHEVPAAIDRLLSEARELRRTLKDQLGKLAAAEADALLGTAVQVGALRVVVRALEGWDPNALKVMATRIAEHPGGAAVLFGLPRPAAIVVARAADVGMDSSALLRELTARFGGRGGGRPELAQGGGLNAEGDELVAAARDLLGAV